QLTDAASVFGARHGGGAQREADIGGGAAAEHRRPLKHDRAFERRDIFQAAPSDAPARRREQPHRYTQQRGFPRAVGTDQHGGRTRRQRHRAGKTFDIAADDDDGADLRRRAAKTGKQRGNEAEARVPDQRHDPAEWTEIHRGEFVAVFDPEILDGLARQRGDDRRDQYGL